MENPDLMQQLHVWAHDVLVWVGFGTIVGLLAKAIMPGRDPGGAVATLMMGVGGTVIGCGTLSFFYDGARISPISAMGMAVGTGGAFVLLFFYRILGGYWFVEGHVPPKRRVQRVRRVQRARQPQYVVEE